MREQEIQNQIRVAVSQNGCTIFRANVGKVKTDAGRWFDTGLPTGFPDLFGFRHSDKQIFYIEVKNENGKPRDDQVKFHEFLMSRNIIHGIARSAADALKIINESLVGYGFGGN
ncbi:VRR-NUC domain-containing protein [Levilactobacillus senmaizukei]|uniref:VRR-NUC domain-containing protein n=1 Tax=Levilactobacillus senmaizukei TaxID=431273 RepID=UPI00077BA801|nr:VRR-NUC domain-containing protein [Levilactobacillus senmaizukei]